MAHGFLVVNRSVPTNSSPIRATNTRDVRMAYDTPFSEAFDDQGPRPCASVKWSATAVCSAARAAASLAAAGWRLNITESFPATNDRLKIVRVFIAGQRFRQTRGNYPSFWLSNFESRLCFGRKCPIFACGGLDLGNSVIRSFHSFVNNFDQSPQLFLIWRVITTTIRYRL